MKKIDIKSKSISDSECYTSIRSVHYDELKQFVRITYGGDTCLASEFLHYLKNEIPEIKDKEVEFFHNDNTE